MVELIRSPLPGSAPEAVVAELGAQPVVGSGPLVRIVHVHAGRLSDPFSGADLGRLAPSRRRGRHHGRPTVRVRRRQWTLSLAFDDGPDPAWTPRILDLLARHHLHATFFVTGQAAARYRDLLRRIVREGHALGNHSLSHRDFLDMSDWRVRLELEGNERLLEDTPGGLRLRGDEPQPLRQRAPGVARGPPRPGVACRSGRRDRCPAPP